MWGFPFNRAAVDDAKMAPSEVYQNSSSDTLLSQNSPSSENPSANDQVSQESGSQYGSDEVSIVLESDNVGVVCPQYRTTILRLMNSHHHRLAPWDVSGSNTRTTPVINPLVNAGLVPGNLADILATSDPEIQPKRRIIKAKVLTEDEFYDTLKEKERERKRKRKGKKRTELNDRRGKKNEKRHQQKRRRQEQESREKKDRRNPLQREV